MRAAVLARVAFNPSSRTLDCRRRGRLSTASAPAGWALISGDAPSTQPALPLFIVRRPRFRWRSRSSVTSRCMPSCVRSSGDRSCRSRGVARGLPLKTPKGPSPSVPDASWRSSSALSSTLATMTRARAGRPARARPRLASSVALWTAVRLRDRNPSDAVPPHVAATEPPDDAPPVTTGKTQR
jgi:hypothetical protein